MLKFLKRLAGFPEEAPAQRSVRRRKAKPAPKVDTGPGALPDVTEGSDESDWELWQDSVAETDSRLQSLGFRDSSQFMQSQFVDTQPSELADLDPFDKVSKNRDA